MSRSPQNSSRSREFTAAEAEIQKLHDAMATMLSDLRRALGEPGVQWIKLNIQVSNARVQKAQLRVEREMPIDNRGGI